METLHIRGWFNTLANSAIEDLARLVVFYDSQPNAGASTIASLFQDSNAGAGTSAQSEINLTNRERFKILRDMQILLPATASLSGVNFPDTTGRLFVNEFIKLKGLEAVYNGVNGGTSADITSGALWIVVFTDLQAGQWQFSFTSRLRYYD